LGKTFLDKFKKDGTEAKVVTDDGCEMKITKYREAVPHFHKQYKDSAKGCQWIGGSDTAWLAIIVNDTLGVSDVEYRWQDEKTFISAVTSGEVYTENTDDPKLTRYVSNKDKCIYAVNLVRSKDTAAQPYDTADLVVRTNGGGVCATGGTTTPIKIMTLEAQIAAGIDPKTSTTGGTSGSQTPDTPIPGYDPCAAGEACSKECKDGSEDNDPATPAGSCFYNVLQTIINFFTAGIGMVVLINIIIGGIQYITSSGNAGQAAKGRTRIQNSLLGFVAYILMYGVLSWLIPGGIGG
jgi:hypothetical protein